MTGIAVAFLISAVAIAVLIFSARRQGAAQAQSATLAAAELQTIAQMKARDELDAQINADPDLLSRARAVMQSDPAK